jgi:hypothetical protein
MDGEPSNLRIIGVGMVLFFSILLGVGIHHMIATGTCSSTGYSADYGPVPTCPKGTGWWFLFLFSGIFGALAGALMSGAFALIFGGIFGGIGFGSLTLLLDSHASNGTKIFGAIFGACFAIVGVIALFFVVRRAFGALSSASGGSSGSSTGLSGPAPSGSGDPILGAYSASQQVTPPAPPRPISAPVSPITVIPGLQAAAPKHSGSANAIAELEKLADLHKRGAVTDAEFAAAKAKLLGEV